MKSTERVSRASHQLVEHVKNNIATTVLEAVNRGELKIDKNLLPRLLAVVNTSADQAYHQAIKGFEKTVAQAIEEEVVNSANETPTKKK